jgi:5-methylcytosine-specific restriction endonuclease McrA
LKIDKRRWRGKYGLRLKVLLRDDYLCQLQLPGCTLTATTVHIAPLLRGNHDPATLDTCISACRRCHGRIDGGRAQRTRWRVIDA